MITDAKFIISGTKIEHYPQDKKTEYLFLGRSNVGKSSLINMITNRKNLARTSSSPGKTITLNYYLLNDSFYLVDAPGYGYAKRSGAMIKSFGEMIDDYLLNRHQLKKVFLLVDYKIGPTNDDKLMYEYLKHYKHKIIILATKIDKLKQKEASASKKRFKEYFQNQKVILTSTVTKKGLDEIIALFEEDL